jgi:hypothetical protein
MELPGWKWCMINKELLRNNLHISPAAPLWPPAIRRKPERLAGKTHRSFLNRS